MEATPSSASLNEIETHLRLSLDAYHLSLTALSPLHPGSHRRVDIEIVSPRFNTILSTAAREQLVRSHLAEMSGLENTDFVVRTKSPLELL